MADRRCLAAVAMLAAEAVLFSGGAARADTPGLLDTVCAAVARLPASRTVPFTEHRTIAALARPVDRSGTLSFTRPDRLEQDTVRPKPERLVIDGDTVTMTAAGNAQRTIALDTVPALRALADTLRAVLAGDAASLRARYDIDATGTIEAWRLLLAPRPGPLRDALVRVTVDGSVGAIRQIDLQQRDGDEQRITIGAGS